VEIGIVFVRPGSNHVEGRANAVLPEQVVDGIPHVGRDRVLTPSQSRRPSSGGALHGLFQVIGSFSFGKAICAQSVRPVAGFAHRRRSV